MNAREHPKPTNQSKARRFPQAKQEKDRVGPGRYDEKRSFGQRQALSGECGRNASNVVFGSSRRQGIVDERKLRGRDNGPGPDSYEVDTMGIGSASERTWDGFMQKSKFGKKAQSKKFGSAERFIDMTRHGRADSLYR